jgi:hypothetical protein
MSLIVRRLTRIGLAQHEPAIGYNDIRVVQTFRQPAGVHYITHRNRSFSILG